MTLSPPDTSRAQPKERFSVLLVDDDAMVIRILSRILGDFRPLRFATSGSVALKLARESVPDLVLLDVEMPDFSGFEVCKAFKSDPLLAAVPIIFITSHESPELETAGLKLGAADFISKPPHASLVLARVRTYQQLKSLSDTVRSAVTMDFLTGTSTRRQLEKTLAQEWLRARRSAAPVSLLLLDIEEFGAFNAQFGEEAGDACLRSVADSLRTIVQRPADLVARHAGGSFALLLPETDGRGVVRIAERALEAAEAIRFTHAGLEHRVKLAAGGACNAFARADHAAADDAVPTDLITAAEYAVKTAKSTQRRPQCIDLAGFCRSAALRSGLKA